MITEVIKYHSDKTGGLFDTLEEAKAYEAREDLRKAIEDVNSTFGLAASQIKTDFKLINALIDNPELSVAFDNYAKYRNLVKNEVKPDA